MSILNALPVLAEHTNGSFNIWRLAGNHNSTKRQEVMLALTGIKTPKAKAGITVITALCLELSGIEGDCVGVRERNFQDWAKQALIIANS
jgi:hypothetical protein